MFWTWIFSLLSRPQVVTLMSSVLPDGQNTQWCLTDSRATEIDHAAASSEGDVTVKLKVAPSAVQDFCFQWPTMAVKHCPHSPSNRYRTFRCHRDLGDLLTHSMQWVMKQKSNFQRVYHRPVSIVSPRAPSEETRFLVHLRKNTNDTLRQNRLFPGAP